MMCWGGEGGRARMMRFTWLMWCAFRRVLVRVCRSTTPSGCTNRACLIPEVIVAHGV